jgi:hypothetical protein
MVTARSAEWYQDMFDGTDSERILDLGSGMSPHAPPNVIRTDYLFRRQTPEAGRGRNAALLFQQLPFPDRTFDRATASWSFEKLKEGRSLATREALRVIKPGGELQITPVWVRDRQKANALEAAGSTQLQVKTEPYEIRGWVGLVVGLETTGVVGVGGVRDLALLGGAFLMGAGAGIIGSPDTVLVESRLTVQRDETLNDPDTRAQFVDTLFDAYKLRQSDRNPGVSTTHPNPTGMMSTS